MQNPFKIGTVNYEIFWYLDSVNVIQPPYYIAGNPMPLGSIPMEFIVRRLESRLKRLEYTRDVRRAITEIKKHGFEVKRHEVQVKRNGKTRTVVCHELIEGD